MIYFCFSDECGSYNREMGKKAQKSHPFYIRTSFIIKGEDWIYLRDKFKKLKECKKYQLPIEKELKWSYVWSLRSHQKKGEVIPESKKYKYLENYNYKVLIDFLWDSLQMFEQLDFCKVICSITEYKKTKKINKLDMLRFHLQEHIQRYQMEIQDSDENLGLIFIDPIDENENIDKELKSHYLNLIENGDLISEYKNLKDNIILENSENSVGIHLADYLSGAINGALRENGNGFYCHAVKMFDRIIEPRLRRDYEDNIMGYGVREVPANQEHRAEIKDQLTIKIKKYCT